jgi:hypothetical protein
MGRQKNFRRQNVRTKRMNVNSKAPPGILFIPILIVASAVLIGYLNLSRRNDDIGRSIKDLEKQRQDLDRRVVNEEFKWANATSPENIQRLLQKHNLLMQLPGEKFVARVKRPTATINAAQRPTGTSLANTATEENLRD